MIHRATAWALRSCTSCAVASAVPTIVPTLPHRPAPRGAQCRRAQTPGGDRIHGGARRRICAGTHDLEIRGAGELLGEQQSGQMTEVGLALYLDMLEQAVKALKDGREPALDGRSLQTPKSSCACPPSSPTPTSPMCTCACRSTSASLPPPTKPLSMSSRPRSSIASAPAPSAQHLLRIARLKLLARALGIRRLDLGPQGGYVLFEQENRVEPTSVCA